MNKLWLLIFSLIIFSSAVFANVAVASWVFPLATPPGNNIPPAVTISTVHQTKTGGLSVKGLTSLNGGVFSKIETGGVVTGGPGEIRSAGDIKANAFCLGTSPSPEGCISDWSQGFGFFGGQAEFLFLWLTANTMGVSSISESGDVVALGTVALPKNLGIGGNLTIDNGGAKPQSALKLSQLAGVSTANLPKATKILSIDTATGEIILTNADCSM